MHDFLTKLRSLGTHPYFFRGCYVFCVLGVILFSVFMLTHPGILPGHGFNGSSHWVEESPAGIRLGGDSSRYLPVEENLSAVHETEYSGYWGYFHVVNGILRCCPNLLAVVIVQIFLACLALWLLMDLARDLSGSSWVSLLTGMLFAFNPDILVWHTFILTESLYISGLIAICWLGWWAQKRHMLVRLPVLLASTVLIATIRPTGWIMVPAVIVYGCLILGKNWRQRLLSLMAASCVGVGVLMSLLSQVQSGIGRQTPTRHLYTGTVVWMDDYWRQTMPDSTGYEDTLSSGISYALHHPLASAELVGRRLVMMILRYRPSYSRFHKLLVLVQVPLILWGLVAMGLLMRRKQAWLPIAVVLAHALVVALTFNDYDSRFSLYAMPELYLMAVWGIWVCWQRWRPDSQIDNSSTRS